MLVIAPPGIQIGQPQSAESAEAHGMRIDDGQNDYQTALAVLDERVARIAPARPGSWLGCWSTPRCIRREPARKGRSAEPGRFPSIAAAGAANTHMHGPGRASAIHARSEGRPPDVKAYGSRGSEDWLSAPRPVQFCECGRRAGRVPSGSRSGGGRRIRSAPSASGIRHW